MTEFEDKVMQILKNMDQKLDKILANGSEAAAPTKKVEPEPVKASEPAPSAPSTVKPSAVVEKQEEEEKAKEKPPVEGRRVCECGSTEFNQVEDKSNVLYQQGGIKIYAKRYVCKKCGKEQ
ncbi:MAG: hypothetical protein EU539_09885 [Promethearchaeota archaeon]|nr:MAG: hypothetical protein EU539_09885 [Candidatus Lokiarchaeota archaeon]